LEKLAWTDGTTRATSLTRTDGILHKTGDQSRMYLGTIRTISTTETCDTGGGSSNQVGGKRFVFNMYNRVRRWLRVIDTANTWNYTTDTWRVANGATAPLNSVEWVDGTGDMLVEAILLAAGVGISNSARTMKNGIGLGNTTPVGLIGEHYFNSTQTVIKQALARYSGYPGVGYRDARWLEKGGDGTSTFHGDNGGGAQSGLDATIWI
jgi:hypothetical protein